MQRIIVRRPGGLERLEIETVSPGLPGTGEVLISTRAIGVNFADCVVRLGLYDSAREYVGWPITPGFEFSGVVSAVGEGVDNLAPGAEVVGLSRFGAYATEVVVPHAFVLPIPKGMSFAQAATFPVVFLTAQYAIHELTRLRPGHAVLVHSASGGVGSALVQVAKRAGATVVAVVGGAHKVASAKASGADVVIDKTREDLWRVAKAHAPKGFHAVFDANGAETLKQSYEHLCPTGRLIIYGFHSMLPRGRAKPNYLKLLIDYLRTPRFHPLDMTNKNKGVLAFNLSYLFDELAMFEEAMRDIVAGFETGVLRPLPVQEIPFADVREAHRLLHSGTTVGKLALIP